MQIVSALAAAVKIHEYQAKELFKQYGIPVQDGILLSEGGDIAAALRTGEASAADCPAYDS